jgi:hypothetical protein
MSDFSATAGACRKTIFSVGNSLSNIVSGLIAAAANSAVEAAPLCPARYRPQAVAACRYRAARRILSPWGPNHARAFTAHRSSRWPTGDELRRRVDIAVEAWNKRMLGFQGPAQPSPTLGDAINAGLVISK